MSRKENVLQNLEVALAHSGEAGTLQGLETTAFTETELIALRRFLATRKILIGIIHTLGGERRLPSQVTTDLLVLVGHRPNTWRSFDDASQALDKWFELLDEHFVHLYQGLAENSQHKQALRAELTDFKRLFSQAFIAWMSEGVRKDQDLPTDTQPRKRKHQGTKKIKPSKKKSIS